MWMPAHTTMPPFFTASSADTTSGPSLAKMMHASSVSGGRLPLPPAQHAPSDRANSCFRASPSRVNTKQRMPMWRASWITMCAEEPKPYSPSVFGDPVFRSDRYPIRPAHGNRSARSPHSTPRTRRSSGSPCIYARQRAEERHRVVAQILLPLHAVLALPATSSQPWNTDLFAHRHHLHVLSRLLHDSHNLMS